MSMSMSMSIATPTPTPTPSIRARRAPFSIKTRPIRFTRVSASLNPNPNPTTHSEGDLNYLLKLGVGTLFGSALIKYGSIVVPDITRPNITQALLMISTPVVIALVLLLKESTKE